MSEEVSAPTPPVGALLPRGAQVFRHLVNARDRAAVKTGQTLRLGHRPRPLEAVERRANLLNGDVA